MEWNSDKLKFSDWEQRLFFDSLLEFIVENLVLRKTINFKGLDIKKLCQAVNTFVPYVFDGTVAPHRFNYGKKKLAEVTAACEAAIETVETQYTVQELTRQFYFEKLRDDAFEMPVKLACFNPELDENMLPVEAPAELRAYVVSLFELFDSIVQTEPTQQYVTELPDELRITRKEAKDYCITRWKVRQILERIILGKAHKDIRLFGHFFYKIPEHKRANISMLIHKSFMRLCSTDNLVLLNDDINSLDFRLAVLDFITFKDKENKILFDNKVAEYRLKTLNLSQNIC